MKNLILILLTFLTVSCSSQKTSKRDWVKDIEFLKTELPRKHKNFFFKKDKSYFEDNLNKIIAFKDELSDFEIAVKLQQLVAEFGDSHTSVKWRKYIKNDKRIPIITYWYKDGIYVIKTTKKNKAILGKKITKINGVTISDVVDKLSSLITVDNQAIIYKKIPNFLNKIQLLEYFNIVKGEKIVLTLETDKEKTVTHNIILEPFIRKNRVHIDLNNIPYYLQNERKYFWSKYIPESDILYIQYNKCWSKEVEQKYGNPKKAKKLPSFVDFKKDIFNIIKNNDIKKLVFDMRFNGGGSSPQGTEFVKKLAQIKSINQKGKLFVVIGRKTFSSAIINTLDFKEYTNAIIVGEETSGKPNHYGEVKKFRLPNSKLQIFYSTNYFERVENDLGTIKPDVEIETTFNDFENGIDLIFEWIKKQ